MAYQLFTDGACKGNPGPGGWAYMIRRDNVPGYYMEQAGSEDPSTNNRMELKALIMGLEQIPYNSEVDIYTDSKYAITVATSRSSKLKNLDLIEDYQDLLACMNVTFHHVRGHSGHQENEYVDRLASNAAKGRIGYRAWYARVDKTAASS